MDTTFVTGKYKIFTSGNTIQVKIGGNIQDWKDFVVEI